MSKPVVSTVYQRSQTCAWVANDNHVTALALGTDDESAPVVLDGSGADIWLVLEEPMTIHAVTRAVANQHGLDASLIVENVEAFLERLVGQRLVVKTSVEASVGA